MKFPSINYLFGALLVLSSCRSELDVEVWNRYFEINEAQDWFSDRVLHRGLDRVESLVHERGQRPTELRVLDELKNEFQSYFLVSDLISESIEKKFNYNGELSAVILKDSLALVIDKTVNKWLTEREIVSNLALRESQTDWLLFELKFREIGLNHLQNKLSVAFWEMQQPKFAYFDSTTLIREVFHSYRKVEVNGQMLDLDSLGIFQLPDERPVTITALKEQMDYLPVKIHDTQFVIE